MTNIAKLPDVSTTVGYVASEIRAHSARRGISGRQLAFQLGKSQPWVSRRLTGEVPFDVEELDAVARLLGVAPRELFPGADSAPDQTPSGMALTEDEERVILALRSTNPRKLVPTVVGSRGTIEDHASVAQGIEHWFPVPGVARSNRVGGTVIDFPSRPSEGIDRDALAPVTSITGERVA